MPVVGHAFVGLAVARVTQPREADATVRAFWPPIMVALAYLPDILTQMNLLLGLDSPRIPAHALPVAAVLAVPIGMGLAEFAPGISRRQGIAIAFLSIALHTLLDCLQTTDRLPFWPIQTRPFDEQLQIIPLDPYREAMVFGIGYLAFAAIWSGWARRQATTQAPLASRSGRWNWVAHLLVTVMLAAALGTHALRSLRERQLIQARQLIDEGRFDEALGWLTLAGRYPNPARPGRIEYLRAVAWQGLGQPTLAEEHYLASQRADPWYFWCVADLGFFYATLPLPSEVRRNLAEPWLRRLREDFAGVPDSPRMIARIERKLAQ